tara:strand:+ start:448 stop:963 length:516 start_codon:yes stop_codon:yes gene_type:complete
MHCLQSLNVLEQSVTTKQDKQNPMHQAVRYLARRDHSRYELKQKLLTKEHTEELVESVLNELQGRAYLDDQRYAEMMVRHHSLRGQGPQKIRSMLNQKGVSKSIIAVVFAEFDQDWYTLASEVRQKRFGGQFKSSDKKEQFNEKSKQMRFLMSRGFESDQIQYAVDKLIIE